ncbi:MAG: class I SAM-dependent methyltransferase [Thermosynechococcaceae cyanobacterium]
MKPERFQLSTLSQWGAACRLGGDRPLNLVAVKCCICSNDGSEPVAVGEDFEYRSSPDTFLMVRCTQCGLVYLNPRPAIAELARIYPPDYHAYDFSEEQFEFVYKVRRKLEARRLLSCCQGLPENARIIDVGCGDGFYLSLLRQFGKSGWQLEGIDPSDLAVLAAHRTGLTIHQGTIQSLDLPKASSDLAFMIATLEHVDDPVQVLEVVRSLLRPGGHVVIVTDNTDTLDFRLFQQRHWGGYHFPRHWNLFNPSTLRQLAQKVDLEVAQLTTILSPVNWVYSFHNALVDWSAPSWLIRQFTLKSTLALGIFTLFDLLHQKLGYGALLHVILRRPR